MGGFLRNGKRGVGGPLRAFLMSRSSFLLVKFLSSFWKNLTKTWFFSFLMSIFFLRCQVFPEKTWHLHSWTDRFLSILIDHVITYTWYINDYLIHNDYINNSSVSVRENSILLLLSGDSLLFLTWSWSFRCIYHLLIFSNSKFKIFDIFWWIREVIWSD